MRKKEERSKQGQTNNNKAAQYSTSKAVTFPKKNELPRVGLEPTTLYTLPPDLLLNEICRRKEARKVMQVRHEFFVPSSADLPIPVPLEVSGHNIRFVLSVEISQVLVLQSRTPAMPDEAGWKSDIYMFTYMDTYIILHTCTCTCSIYM